MCGPRGCPGPSAPAPPLSAVPEPELSQRAPAGFVSLSAPLSASLRSCREPALAGADVRWPCESSRLREPGHQHRLCPLHLSAAGADVAVGVTLVPWARNPQPVSADILMLCWCCWKPWSAPCWGTWAALTAGMELREENNPQNSSRLDLNKAEIF